MNDIYQRLREPFKPEEIDWRIQQSGKGNKGIWAKVLAYMDARAPMDRLDEVVGPANWQDSYHPGPDTGVLCRLSLRINDEWITKEDAAENTNVEAVKGGVSDSFKRAAVKWGIGRYLYDLPEGWANVHEGGKNFAKTKEGDSFRWDPPPLPAWALPAGYQSPEKQEQAVRDERRNVMRNANVNGPDVDELAKKMRDEGAKAAVEPSQAADAPKQNGADSGLNIQQKNAWLNAYKKRMDGMGVTPKQVMEVIGGTFSYDAIHAYLSENSDLSDTAILEAAKEA